MADPNTLRDIEVEMWKSSRERHLCKWGVELLEEIRDKHDADISELNQILDRKYGTRKLKRWMSRGEMPEWYAREVQHFAETGEVGTERPPHECSPIYLASKLDKIEDEHGAIDREPITI